MHTTKIDSKTQQELQIQRVLRTGGFLFPETIEEVKEFEKNFGDTDVILPEDLRTPNFLDKKVNDSPKIIVASINHENYSVAAREGSQDLPESIRLKMEEDRIKIEKKAKRRK